MVVSKIHGGLGNQLFMYAIGYAMARRNNDKLTLDATLIATDMRDYGLGSLNLKYDKLYKIRKDRPYFVKVALRKLLHSYMYVRYRMVKEKQGAIYDQEVANAKGNIMLDGYWVTYKYCEPYKAELQKMFVPTYQTSASFNKLQSEMKHTNSISLHVRRGDYVALGICLEVEYYKRAVEYMLQHVENPTFYVFSNDMDFCKDFLKDINAKIVFVKYDMVDPAVDDLLLMQSCHHNIIANSTFSWWGAYMNATLGQIVVCPKEKVEDDKYPKEWIKI